MNATQALQAFFVDQKFQAAVALVTLNFVLGVCAALKTRTFKLSYLSHFAETDGAKLVAWLAVYVAVKLGAGNQQIAIPGLDLSPIVLGMWTVLVAGWSGSILKSLGDLGFPSVATVTKSVLATVTPTQTPPPPPPAPPAPPVA
jgi:hypothetical protein